MKVPRTLAVLLFDAVVGEVAENTNGKPVFAYKPAWTEHGPGIPLSLSLPMAALKHGPTAVAPYLWGLLPDSEVRLEAIARAISPRIPSGNPVALLGEVGEDCAGAVQFVRPDRLESLEENGVEWLDEAAVAELLRCCREGEAPGFRAGSRTRGKYSVAGMQPKVALHRRESVDGLAWGTPRGRTPTTHILKPPIPHLRGQIENEHFCLRLASALGFAAASSEVMSFGDERAIVVERYDRIEQQDGGPSPERIVRDVLRGSAAPAEVVEADVRRFLAAIALNWVIAGTDAHGKNFSILHGRDRVLGWRPCTT